MKYVTGNLLDSKTKALVNTINTQGVMGKGIAFQFKERFPNNFKIYHQAFKRSELSIGKMLVVEEYSLQGEYLIINFPTKTEWFKKSQYSYIEEGLKDLVQVIRTYHIESIAIPPLGCGNGGLSWVKVKALIEKYLGSLKGVEVIVYEPSESIKELLKSKEPTHQAKLTPARAMLLNALHNFMVLGEDASLFAANKLAYFLQRLGEPMRLNFTKARYGPYAIGVEKVLNKLNGTYLTGLEQLEAKPFEALELNYSKRDEIDVYIKENLTVEQKMRLNRLIELLNGYEANPSIELLASVDYLMQENSDANLEQICEGIQNWTDRKAKLFQTDQIKIAYNHLLAFDIKPIAD